MFCGPQAKYKQLLLSLGNVRNYRLVASVLAGNTTPVDLATKVSLFTFNGPCIAFCLIFIDFYRVSLSHEHTHAPLGPKSPTVQTCLVPPRIACGKNKSGKNSNAVLCFASIFCHPNVPNEMAVRRQYLSFLCVCYFFCRF